MRFPGGKNLAGTFQRIINQIPPHDTFVEPFAGSAAIARLKRPAKRTILIDVDPGALVDLGDQVPPNTAILEADALGWLQEHAVAFGSSTFIYCDPPYLATSCRSRLRYKHTLTTAGHRQLLEILRHLLCPVMISGYWSRLYEKKLAGWRTDHFPAITRGGYTIEEWLWMNYPAPLELHDYRYLGDGFREREKFRRQQRRWTARLARMDRLQRQALLAAIAAANLVPSTEPAMMAITAGPPARNGDGRRRGRKTA
jgi:DNA adenine methylase